MKKILRTNIPFNPNIRVLGQEVATELMEEIEKIAKLYGKKVKDFSAKFELTAGTDWRGRYSGHYLISQVVYEKGELKKTNK